MTMIVLRTIPDDPRDTFDPDGKPSGPHLELEIEPDDERAKAEFRQSRGVFIARPMPMKLIAPVSTSDASGELKKTATWGVEAVGADESPFTGQGVTVAVLDTGIDRDHSAFTGLNIIEQDFTGEGDGDRDGHGTHCAGTILGRSVSGSRIGVAPGVERALIGKVIGEKAASTDWLAQALDWALDNGAQIISMSLGIDFPGYAEMLRNGGLPGEIATSRALADYRANLRLFDKLSSLIRSRDEVGKGTLVVAASGNESLRDKNPDYVVSASPPAAAEDILAVAAVGQNPDGSLHLASFSNSDAQVAAPGVDILSAKASGGLSTLSGTSMATPHVGGVAAMWAEKIRNENDGQLSTAVLQARVTGLAVPIPGINQEDVGAGCVRAPA